MTLSEAVGDASDELVLMGDFNIDVKIENCDSNYYPTESIKSVELLCDLQLLHTVSTRVNINSSTHVICAIFSDHMAIYSVITFKEPVSQYKYLSFRSFKHFNINNFADKSDRFINVHYCFHAIFTKLMLGLCASKHIWEICEILLLL